MSSVQLVAFFQTVLSLMISTFPVIDTDEKKKKVSSAVEPLLRLIIKNNREFHRIVTGNDTWCSKCGLKNFGLFLRLIKTDKITFDTLLSRISSVILLVKKAYDDEYDLYLQSKCYGDCPHCIGYFPTMRRVISEILETREEEEAYSRMYDDYNEEAYSEEPDFEKPKFDLVCDFETKIFHRSNDVIRHKRNKGQIASHRNVRLPKNRKITKPPKNLRFDITV